MKKSYKYTKVNWGKTQAQITKLLSEQNIHDVRFTFLQSQHQLICEYNHPTEIQNKTYPIGIRIIWNIFDESEQEKNRSHRALYHYLKSKFSAINEGTVEVIKEFMPHIVIFDKNGISKTLYEIIIPQYQRNLIEGKQHDIKMIEQK